jgi:uncharacterized protein YbjT (DUF2867 family)
MNYVLTGSIGNITKPIAQKLIAQGNSVNIITSHADHASTIEAMGAKALVGSVEDASFIENTFKGADAIYLMIPPKWTVTNWFEYQQGVAANYIAAIVKNDIKNVVVLSSVGAHMRKGAGPVDGIAYLEEQLLKLENVNTYFLRPSYFYMNLFSMIPLIKNANIMGSNQPASHKLVLTHTSDIAEVAAEVLTQLNFSGNTVRYIASDERTWEDITQVLSNIVGKPGIPWVEFTDEQAMDGMLQAGLPETIAKGYVDMGAALRKNEMEADYWNHKPQQLGKIKLEDFAQEFAAAYQAS